MKVSSFESYRESYDEEMDSKEILQATVLSGFLVLGGLSFSGCSKPEQQLAADFPGLSEEYPSIEPEWFKSVLLESGSAGVYVLEKNGRVRSQRKERPMTPEFSTNLLRSESDNWTGALDIHSEDVIEQFTNPLILIEPGCAYKEFQEVLNLCHYFGSTIGVSFVVWNQSPMVTQVTSSKSRAFGVQPSYGNVLGVEAMPSSSGEVHFRWWFPDSRPRGSDPSPEWDEPYGWTEVESLEETIHQLIQQFGKERIIKLEPGNKMDMENVIKAVHGFSQAAFLEVDLLW